MDNNCKYIILTSYMNGKNVFIPIKNINYIEDDGDQRIINFKNKDGISVIDSFEVIVTMIISKQI